MFRKALQKVRKEATWTLLLSTAIVGFGSGFYQGYNKAVINTPQTVVALWIRRNECARLNSSQHHDANETEKWCKELSKDDEQIIFKENSSLNFIWTCIASAYMVGCIVGVLAICPVAHRFGRKGALLLNSVPCIASPLIMALSYFAQSYWMLGVGRFLSGVGAEICGFVASLYLAEIAPVSLGGLFGVYRGVCLFGGQLMAQILGHPSLLGTSSSWPILFGLGLIPAVVQLVALPFCPESPSFLLLYREDGTKGATALKKLRGGMTYEIDLTELENRKKFDGEANKSVSLIGLWRDPFLRYCIILSVMMNVGSELVGYTAILFYSTSIFRLAGFPHSIAAIATIGTGILMLLSTLILAAFVDKVGRRVLLLSGFAGMLVVTCAITVFTALFESLVKERPEDQDNLSSWTTYASATCVYLFLIFYTLGPGTVPGVLAGEMFTHGPSTAAVCTSMAASSSAAFVVSLVFPLVKNEIGAYTFLLFVVVQIFYIFYTYFKVPETKRREEEDVSTTLRKQWQHKASS